jgi:hypothetical protein
VIISVVWFFFSASAAFGPHPATVRGVLLSLPVIVIALPTLPFIMTCFLSCQLSIHDAMVEYKRKKLQDLDGKLRATMPDQVGELSKDRQEAVEFLLKRRTEVNALPEWPFSNEALATVTSSAVSAAAPVLFKVVMSLEWWKQAGIQLPGAE